MRVDAAFMDKLYAETLSPKNRPLLRKRTRLWRQWLEENTSEGIRDKWRSFPDSVRWKKRKLRLDGNKFFTTQSADQTSIRKMKRYSRYWYNGACKEPVVLIKVAKNTYFIEDGHHRYFAALRRGAKTINAQVTEAV